MKYAMKNDMTSITIRLIQIIERRVGVRANLNFEKVATMPSCHFV